MTIEEHPENRGVSNYKKVKEKFKKYNFFDGRCLWVKHLV